MDLWVALYNPYTFFVWHWVWHTKNHNQQKTERWCDDDYIIKSNNHSNQHVILKWCTTLTGAQELIFTLGARFDSNVEISPNYRYFLYIWPRYHYTWFCGWILSPRYFHNKSKWASIVVARCVGDPWKRTRTIPFNRISDCVLSASRIALSW